MPTVQFLSRVGIRRPGDIADLDQGSATWAVQRGHATYVRADKVPTFHPDDDIPDELGDEDPERPPTAGRGSGRQQWATYATRIGVPVTPTMTRADIIQAVDDATRT